MNMEPKIINKIKKQVESNGLAMFIKISGLDPVMLINECGLNYKTYEDIEFNWVEYLGGVTSSTFFDNGYGVSVVKHDGSYGGKQGLYELAVLKEGDICYETEITNDVIGYLTPESVTEIMIKVQELKNYV